MKITKAQQKAIKRLYDRAPMYKRLGDEERISYKEFRKTAMPTCGCDNAIAISWAGMWVCVETDGYSHT
jgi:hypothetical protein